MSELDRVTALYGSGDTSPGESKATPDTTTDSGDQVIQALYGGSEAPPAGNPYALDSGSTEDQLYGAEDRVHLDESLDLADLTTNTEEASNLHRNLGYIAAAAGATGDDVADLVRLAGDHHASGAGYLSQADRHAATQELIKDFGTNGRQLLADARDLVASFPELADWLAKTGAGDNPAIARRMMQLAKTPKGIARLNAHRSKQGV